jgi:hypothetical protein
VLLDVAEAELRRGQPGRAADLLREALRTRIDPLARIRAVTMLVRAEGGRGDRTTVQEEWHRAAALIDACGTDDGPRLLLDLAYAGAEVHEDAQADIAAYRAMTWATRLGDHVLMDACSLFLSRPRHFSGKG